MQDLLEKEAEEERKRLLSTDEKLWHAFSKQKKKQKKDKKASAK